MQLMTKSKEANMRKANIVTITGAGSTRTPALIGTLVKMKDRFPVSKVIFYDIDQSRFDLIKDYVLLILKEYSPETEVVIAQNPEEAYSKTDFVFTQIRVGGGAMRSYDEKVPLRHGIIGQETCGPGGFAYGMRSIGAMIEMIDCIRSYSKDTWILNYTNPAAIVAVALDMKYPEDKRIINMCDQPYSMMVSFAKILNTDAKKLRCNYFGLNHFGWFTDLYDVDGNNYFGQMKDYFKHNDFKPYNAEQRSKSWLDTYLRVNKMMAILDEYIPNTYLEYYFYQDEIVEESDINFTRADETMQTREADVWKLTKQAIGNEMIGEIEILTSPVFGAMMVEVAESIAYDLNSEFVVMIKNKGIIPNFNEDAIVEVIGTLGKDGVKAEPYGEIGTFYKGLMETQYAYERLTCEAYFEKDYTKAVQALSLNRTVNSLDKAVAVLDDLMEVNEEYWTLERK